MKPRPGRPPLSLALGFRVDPEARDLSRGGALYAKGELEDAAVLFDRHDSLEAKVGSAFSSWPAGTLDRVEQLAKLYPESAAVQFHLGLARLWAQRGDPVSAWRAAIEAEPDTPYAILAGNLLHPKLPRGLPGFIPSFAAPAEVVRLPPRRQLQALRRRAEERRHAGAPPLRRRASARGTTGVRRGGIRPGRVVALPGTPRRR